MLKCAKKAAPGVVTTTILSLGVCKTKDQVVQTMRDAKEAGVGTLIPGQYLQPSPNHLEMIEYVHPEIFEEYGRVEEDEVGFAYVFSRGRLSEAATRRTRFFEGFFRRPNAAAEARGDITIVEDDQG